ncbi:hypothetical protein VC83_00498 [Pseudogymnoascus destructans]|uniref:NCT transcriptional regulatory complex subunit A n=2 Tax=Pseudogymnoascus destructans TaxID=655981 RepID=L8GCJ9_PSED2|nr:uncharacterized protein VC83_00498 [Pseudogymnoascus destructans]ELR10408.1 hypothetical protein GMDG_00820 [Pseudogymnoascus destructans 20631-21]OAF63226.1 hypothetical protein VC83_00498 [Pseudogymnoascus destructans]
MPADGTYAPQSPDLSSFLSSTTTPVQQQHPHQQQQQQHHQPPTSAYTPRSPRLPDFTSPQSSSISSSSGYQVPPSPQQYQGFGDSRRNSSYQPPIPDLPPTHTFEPPRGQYTSPAYHAPTLPYSQAHSPPQNYSRQSYSLPQQALTYQPPPPQPPQAPHQQLHEQLHIKSETRDDTMTGRVKRERVGAAPRISEDVKPHLGASQGIEIKTKFPVARIKRIMQADEEVGKVAQVTPVAVSKALELFMISLVTKSASLTRSTNSKRVTAVHLKKAIEADEQFDFLNDIVSKIADGPDAGQGKRTKEEDGSDSDEKPKKKGRRKKGE